jgi:hypothetical protein
MAASLAGAVKAYLETLGLGVPVFRDFAPRSKQDGSPQRLPFIVVQDGLGDVPRRTGDNKSKRTTELVQIDVYEFLNDPDTGDRAESYTLAKEVLRNLTQTRLPSAPERVWRLGEFGRTRTLDAENNGVRNVITLSVIRNL